MVLAHTSSINRKAEQRTVQHGATQPKYCSANDLCSCAFRSYNGVHNIRDGQWTTHYLRKATKRNHPSCVCRQNRKRVLPSAPAAQPSSIRNLPSLDTSRTANPSPSQHHDNQVRCYHPKRIQRFTKPATAVSWRSSRPSHTSRLAARFHHSDSYGSASHRSRSDTSQYIRIQRMATESLPEALVADDD